MVRAPHPGRRGFTLIELLVVVGIIILLMAILIPTLGRTRAKAREAGAKEMMAQVQQALETYHGDMNMYPESRITASGSYKSTKFVAASMPQFRGSSMLAQALVGYLPFDADGAGDDTSNLAVTATNPHPDAQYGFRLRRSTMGGTGGSGKIYGPYVQPTPKNFAAIATFADGTNTLPAEAVLIDPWGTELLYFKPVANPPIGAPGTLFDSSSNTPPATPTSTFLAKDCQNVQTPLKDGSPISPVAIDASSASNSPQFFKAIYEGGNGTNTYTGGKVLGSDSYLLISAGADGVFFQAPEERLYDDLIVAKPQ